MLSVYKNDGEGNFFEAGVTQLLQARDEVEQYSRSYGDR